MVLNADAIVAAVRLTYRMRTLGSYVARNLGRNVKNVVHVASRNPSKLDARLRTEAPFLNSGVFLTANRRPLL